MAGKMKWIFFDLGGTIVDEMPVHRKRIQIVADKLLEWGVPLSAGELFDRFERSSMGFPESPFLEMLSKLDITEEQRKIIAEKTYYDHADEVLYPGVQELLSKLEPKFNLGVIANQSLGTENRLQSWKILQHFSIVLGSAEVGMSKPDQRLFKYALEKAECEPENAIMIGDRLDNDIGPAKILGWKAIRVLQGVARYQSPRNKFEEPDQTVDTIGEVEAALEKL